MIFTLIPWLKLYPPCFSVVTLYSFPFVIRRYFREDTWNLYKQLFPYYFQFTHVFIWCYLVLIGNNLLLPICIWILKFSHSWPEGDSFSFLFCHCDVAHSSWSTSWVSTTIRYCGFIISYLFPNLKSAIIPRWLLMENYL